MGDDIHRRPASILLWKAGAHFRLKQLEQAEVAARAALERDPHSEAAVTMLALSLLHLGRADDAVDICDGFLAGHPKSEVVAQYKIDMAKVVAKSARRHIQKFGANGSMLSQLANACLELGELDRADRAFRKAAKLEPQQVDHHVGIILLAHLRNDYETAEEYRQTLKARDPMLAKRVDKAVHKFFASR